MMFRRTMHCFSQTKQRCILPSTSYSDFTSPPYTSYLRIRSTESQIKLCQSCLNSSRASSSCRVCLCCDSTVGKIFIFQKDFDTLKSIFLVVDNSCPNLLSIVFKSMTAKKLVGCTEPCMQETRQRGLSYSKLDTAMMEYLSG